MAAAAAVVACAVVTAAAGSDYAEGPPPAHTGGFGEPNCRACHADYPLDDGGTLAIEGAPATFAAGATYTLRVVLRHPELRRAGFQLSARYAAGPAAGTQAGILSVASDIGQIVESGGVAYAQQVRAGSGAERPGERVWDVRWVAPDRADADVVLHVAANAANDDASEFGDRIHAASIVVHAPSK